MVAAILPKIYIDKKWVAQEYLRRCKAGAWKKESTISALKCGNSERIIDAKLHCQSTTFGLTLNQLVKEEVGECSFVGLGADDHRGEKRVGGWMKEAKEEGGRRGGREGRGKGCGASWL